MSGYEKESSPKEPHLQSDGDCKTATAIPIAIKTRSWKNQEPVTFNALLKNH
jgi:hypothetical protein